MLRRRCETNATIEASSAISACTAIARPLVRVMSATTAVRQRAIALIRQRHRVSARSGHPSDRRADPLAATGNDHDWLHRVPPLLPPTMPSGDGLGNRPGPPSGHCRRQLGSTRRRQPRARRPDPCPVLPGTLNAGQAEERHARFDAVARADDFRDPDPRRAASRRQPRSSPARTRTPPTATPGATSKRRARRLVRVAAEAGRRQPSDRVGTLAWNGYRHLEVYYAAPGMQAICHTINPRLHPDDIAYIINHAQDKVLFVDMQLRAADQPIAPRIAGSRAGRRHADRRRPHAGRHAGARHDAALLRHS